MTKTVKGRVQSVNDKEDNDWFGICINDTWYNGDDSLTQDVTDFKLKIEYEDQDDWNKIQRIDVLEEGSEGGGQGRSSQESGKGNRGSNTGSNPSSLNDMSPRQAGSTANSAVKMAAEHTNKDYGEDPKEYIDEVNEMSKAFNNMIKDRLGENL